jgi:hypothetical protein
MNASHNCSRETGALASLAAGNLEGDCLFPPEFQPVNRWNFHRHSVFFPEGHWPIVRSHMLIRHTLLICSAAGLALSLASPVEAAKKHRKSTVQYHPTLYRQAAVPGSVFQGGVLAGPLYNGQDYIGDDPDPNIRSYLIRDETRYGGRD